MSELSAPRLKGNLGPEIRKLYRWTRPCFCLRHPKARSHALARRTLTNAATRHLSQFRLVLTAPKTPCRRQTSPPPVPQPADGVLVSEPIWERPAGPKTHSRRTGRRLGQTRRARQGLVRVPESNTKYGGKRGITGGTPAPVIGPSISESSEIPKPKKLFGGAYFSPAPAVHRTSIYSLESIALWRLT